MADSRQSPEAEVGKRIKASRFGGGRELDPKAEADDPDSVFARAKDFLFGKPAFGDVQGGANALSKPKR